MTTFIFSVATISVASFTTVAVSYSGEVDNDTSNPNFSNNSGMATHCYTEWGTYLNTGKNGDSRLRQSTTTANYEWVWNGSMIVTSTLNMSLNIYLNNTSFNDTHALYRIYNDTSDYNHPIDYFYLNQDTAVPGYNLVYRQCTPQPGTLYRPWYALVQNSGYGGVGTGADAFNFMFTYAN